MKKNNNNNNENLYGTVTEPKSTEDQHKPTEQPEAALPSKKDDRGNDR